MVEVLGFLFGLRAVGRWYERLWRAAPPRTSAAAGIRLLFTVLPVVLVLGLMAVLGGGAAREVRESSEYTLLFLLLGIVWLAATLEALAWLGISSADDAIERDNVAAGVAVAGALCAAMFSYACSNVGEGPTIWMTIGPALLGFIACTALWLLYQALSGAADAIAIDRDLASGVRFAVMALGSSFFVGRSLIGDYVSVDATSEDLWQQGWPALPLVVFMAAVQRASWGPWR